MTDRAADLIALLDLQPHPEGGHYRETFRSPASVQPTDGRPPRSALTSIDFLLTAGQCSRWHRVQSDEIWHLLEGGPLRLWLLPPDVERDAAATAGTAVHTVKLAPASATTHPVHVVPAGWWQATELLGAHALAACSVAPGFEFADFAFAREHAHASAAIRAAGPDASALL